MKITKVSFLLCIFVFAAAINAGGESVAEPKQTDIVISKPQRVISTFLGADEMLKEILVRAGRLHHLKAVSSMADNPDYSHIIPVPKIIKGRIGEDLEAILTLKPDLAVAASFNRPEIVRRLEQAKVPTVVLSKFNSFADIETNIRTLGQLVGETASADQLVNEFRAALHKTSQPPKGQKPKTVLTYMANGTVHGSGTTFDDIARYSGTQNLAATMGYQGWVRLSPEVLATLNPDFLVAAGEPKDLPAILATIRKTPGFSSMPAAMGQRVILIPGRDLTAISHFVIRAVSALHTAAYP